MAYVMFTVQDVAQARGSGAEQGAQGSMGGILRLPGSCRASMSQWEPLGKDPGTPKDAAGL